MPITVETEQVVTVADEDCELDSPQDSKVQEPRVVFKHTDQES